jgi:hypothetical protein
MKIECVSWFFPGVYLFLFLHFNPPSVATAALLGVSLLRLKPHRCTNTSSHRCQSHNAKSHHSGTNIRPALWLWRMRCQAMRLWQIVKKPNRDSHVRDMKLKLREIIRWRNHLGEICVNWDKWKRWRKIIGVPG